MAGSKLLLQLFKMFICSTFNVYTCLMNSIYKGLSKRQEGMYCGRRISDYACLLYRHSTFKCEAARELAINAL